MDPPLTKVTNRSECVSSVCFRGCHTQGTYPFDRRSDSRILCTRTEPGLLCGLVLGFVARIRLLDPLVGMTTWSQARQQWQEVCLRQ